MNKDASTEQKIKNAAKQVFLAKGFSGCSSREIAKVAGMNVALVNYYFRSKELLFNQIFQAAMEDFMLSMVSVFSSEASLEEKMKIFISSEYEFLAKHPELPAFILNEMNRQDGCSSNDIELFQKISETGIFEECLAAQKKGEMRTISLLSIMLLTMSNCQYPVMAANLMKKLHGISDEEYTAHLLIHKEYITEMLLNYLFIKHPKIIQ
jgi:TetR/AcrR family transcriptional regulator